MPAPQDEATTALTTLSATIRTFYHKKFPEMHQRFGNRTSKLFKPSERTLDGDGIVVQVKSANLMGARMGRDLLADFPTPRAHTADSYKATISETPSANDFSRLSISLQVSHWDIQRNYNADQWSDNFVETLISDSGKDIAESTALHCQLDRTSRLATISGTPTKNDDILVASASAIAATGGGRFVVANGSVATFPKNIVLDVYNGNAYTGSVIVTDYNPRDQSVGVYGLNANGEADSTVDVSGILANGYGLYKSGEKDVGMTSIGEWFKAPTSGESFLTRDRTTPQYRWMRPTLSGPTSSTTFSKSHIDQAMLDMGYITEEDEGGYVMTTTLELEQRYRNEIGNDIIVQWPSDDEKGKMLAGYGFSGSIYRHPRCGRVMFNPDPFAPTTKIRFLRVGDWEACFAGAKTFTWLPGFAGNWKQVPSSTPGGGYAPIYRMEGLLARCDICTNPRLQLEIQNLAAA